MTSVQPHEMKQELHPKQLEYTTDAYSHQTCPPYPGQPSTTVIIQQPRTDFGGRLWSSPICSCCDDMESCCCTFLCPTCYLTYLYSKYDECCCSSCCVAHPLVALRVQHRNRHKVSGTILNDCMTSTFCFQCSMCQLKRDMDYVMASKGRLAM